MKSTVRFHSSRRSEISYSEQCPATLRSQFFPCFQVSYSTGIVKLSCRNVLNESCFDQRCLGLYILWGMRVDFYVEVVRSHVGKLVSCTWMSVIFVELDFVWVTTFAFWTKLKQNREIWIGCLFSGSQLVVKGVAESVDTEHIILTRGFLKICIRSDDGALSKNQR